VRISKVGVYDDDIGEDLKAWTCARLGGVGGEVDPVRSLPGRIGSDVRDGLREMEFGSVGFGDRLKGFDDL